MTIEKLSSGSYRASVMRQGKRYRITFDHKPTKREAEDALNEKIASECDKPNGSLTFSDACDKYVEMKSNVLSPNTIREYSLTKKRLAPWFVSMPIDDIDQVAINRQINEISADHSPKTVRNYHGLISAILGTFRPQLKIYTTLPQNRKSEAYMPSDEDIKRIMAELFGTEYYVATVLACYGLRRGEILALEPSDVESDGTVHITKSLAIDSDRKKVIKTTKTTASERDIYVPSEIAAMIHAQGYVYRRKPGGIREKLLETENKLGIPRFTLHTLRHYFAAKMLTLTDEQTAQLLGGWKTNSVMKTVYAYSIKEEQERAKRLAADNLKQSIL